MRQSPSSPRNVEMPSNKAGVRIWPHVPALLIPRENAVVVCRDNDLHYILYIRIHIGQQYDIDVGSEFSLE